MTQIDVGIPHLLLHLIWRVIYQNALGWDFVPIFRQLCGCFSGDVAFQGLVRTIPDALGKVIQAGLLWCWPLLWRLQVCRFLWLRMLRLLRRCLLLHWLLRLP